MRNRIIIAGPTASGKSSLAISLALKTGGEIISVDSRQCYRLLDIGTAKPTPEQLVKVPHHNISVLDPDESDSVANFRKRALNSAREIEQREHPVIFCGGSTLHLQSLITPLDDIPSADEENLTQLKQEDRDSGLKSLYGRLKEIDPDYASSMDGMNRQRIYRALDVWMQTGKPFSSFHSHKETILPGNLTLFVLHHPRKELHRRIEERTDQMVKNGLVDEVRSLLSRGYSRELQSLQTVGYRQVIRFLNGEISYDQAVKDIKTATRRYAKRQITWLRRWKFAKQVDMSQLNEKDAVSYIQQQVAAESQKG